MLYSATMCNSLPMHYISLDQPWGERLFVSVYNKEAAIDVSLECRGEEVSFLVTS